MIHRFVSFFPSSFHDCVLFSCHPSCSFSCSVLIIYIFCLFILIFMLSLCFHFSFNCSFHFLDIFIVVICHFIVLFMFVSLFILFLVILVTQSFHVSFLCIFLSCSFFSEKEGSGSTRDALTQEVALSGGGGRQEVFSFFSTPVGVFFVRGHKLSTAKPDSPVQINILSTHSLNAFTAPPGAPKCAHSSMLEMAVRSSLHGRMWFQPQTVQAAIFLGAVPHVLESIHERPPPSFLPSAAFPAPYC